MCSCGSSYIRTIVAFQQVLQDKFSFSLFSDLRSLAGTTLLSLLASLFMGQLLFVIGVGGIQVRKVRENDIYFILFDKR